MSVALPAELPSVDKAALQWLGVIRLGLVQAALGSVVVLLTSTLNRVMVVEYSLPAVLPGALVALHYLVQVCRPRFGFESDEAARRTPWIVGGVAVLAVGCVLCAIASLVIAAHPWPGLTLAVAAYVLVGLGVGSAGTSLLVLMAKRVPGSRRAAAATLMWILMIVGFAVTSTVVGHFLDPFSPGRLMHATCAVAAAALLVTVAALWNLEGAGDASPRRRAGDPRRPETRATGSFKAALGLVWAEPASRRFTFFVFLSMLAYSAQELLLEPFAGLVFGYTLGESTQLSGLWHGSTVIGMIGVGIVCSNVRRLGSLRGWTLGGCVGSAVALTSLAVAGLVAPVWPLRTSVMLLGSANGIFAVAAIGSMMELSQQGDARHAGVRMGLWGAAQAVAFAAGGLLGTSILDSVRRLSGSSNTAFATVFVVEASLFLTAALYVAKVNVRAPQFLTVAAKE